MDINYRFPFHFRLPTDGLVKEKWLNIIRVQRRENDWLPTPYTKVCSKHFSASDIYVTKKNYRRIKKTAVPIITVKSYVIFTHIIAKYWFS